MEQEIKKPIPPFNKQTALEKVKIALDFRASIKAAYGDREIYRCNMIPDGLTLHKAGKRKYDTAHDKHDDYPQHRFIVEMLLHFVRLLRSRLFEYFFLFHIALLNDP